MQSLADDIRYIKGIGPKKAENLNKLGIFTLEDALYYYPRDYEDRTVFLNVSDVIFGEKALIHGVVGTIPKTAKIRKGMDITTFKIYDDSGVLAVTYFNNKFVAQKLKVGMEYCFYGIIQRGKLGLSLVNPEFEEAEKSGSVTGCILPVYPLSSDVSRKDIIKVVSGALSVLPNSIEDILPQNIIDKNRLVSGERAIRLIHSPKTKSDILDARRRLIFEELFILSCGLCLIKSKRDEKKGVLFKKSNLKPFYNELSFIPTGAQIRAINDIKQDLMSGIPMNRLIQGDVGSGKTVVSAAACFMSVKNDYQCAFMVPTEILANQHFESLKPIFELFGIKTVLLTASLKAKEKREVLHKIESGEADVVIGTHAIIQDSVKFKNLALAIVDEQHRFGVNQRANLVKKGENINVLVMSATPIPRSLALIMYGDLDVSIIDEMPPDRQKVDTFAVGEKMRKRIYAFIEKQCAEGGQVYVVCPSVEDGELDIKSVEGYYKELCEIFPNRKVGFIHGRLNCVEKDAIMVSFLQRKIDILVATTVIEVGVNVPNANLMVVEDADRFGLSQLHQLRGRVGRGKRKSYAIFFGADKGEKVKERLKILCDTTDGFKISKADLEIRGPGDFFGSRQHGLPLLKLADLANDLELLNSAQLSAEILTDSDRNLEKYPLLKARIQKLFDKENGDIFN